MGEAGSEAARAAPSAVRARVHTALREAPLDVGEAHVFLARPGAGAAAVFTGTVRDHADGRAVTGLTYEAYRQLAEQRLAEIAEVLVGAEGVLAVWMEHRLGALAVGEVSVVVGVSAAHRAEAFERCRQGIDTLKAEVPIWKREHWADGGAHWPGTD